VAGKAVGRAIIADAHSLERLGIQTVLKQAFPCNSEDADDFAGLIRLMASPALVAVVDWDLPGFSSPNQIRELRTLYPATRIIVVCTQCRVETVLALLACGVHGIIPKTLTAKDIQTAFALVAGGFIYVPAYICDLALSSNSHSVKKPLSRAGQLSVRQNEVVRLAANGESNKQIARLLSIAEGTVKVHLGAAFRNMGVNNRARAVAVLGERDEQSTRKIFL
jgi:DNA-binding NarL/FixJ family response regulator